MDSWHGLRVSMHCGHTATVVTVQARMEIWQPGLPGYQSERQERIGNVPAGAHTTATLTGLIISACHGLREMTPTRRLSIIVSKRTTREETERAKRLGWCEEYWLRESILEFRSSAASRQRPDRGLC